MISISVSNLLMSGQLAANGDADLPPDELKLVRGEDAVAMNFVPLTLGFEPGFGVLKLAGAHLIHSTSYLTLEN